MGTIAEIYINMDIFTYCHSETLTEYVQDTHICGKSQIWKEIQDLPTEWKFNLEILKKSIYSSYCQEKVTEYV